MKKLKFIVSLIMENNCYQRLHASAAQDVAHRLAVDLQILYSGNDAIAQNEQLLHAIDSPSGRPDGIICAPVGTTMAHVAHHAVERGVAWAVLNRECDYMAELRNNNSIPVFSVSVDQSEIGRIQARQMTALLPRGGLALYILGPTSSSVVHNRESWMQSVKPGNIQVRTLVGDWSQESGYNVVRAWLQLFTSLTTPVGLVAAQCDDMAMGARKALEALTSGKEWEHHWSRVPFIGCDGCPEGGQRWVRAGLLTATIINPPTAGTALEMMVHAIQTKAQPRERTLVASTSFPAIEKAGEKLRGALRPRWVGV